MPRSQERSYGSPVAVSGWDANRLRLPPRIATSRTAGASRRVRVPRRRPASGCEAPSSPGKNSSISRAADSALSEPWTRFSVSSSARSPRIVPGRRLGGIGRPHQDAHDLPGVGRALDDHDHGRAPGDELDEVVVERLARRARRSAGRPCSASIMRNSAATMRRPLRSRRPTISPTSRVRRRRACR